MTENNELYNYVFHYSEHTHHWNAIPRELYKEYWNNFEAEGILSSKEHSTLVQIILKGPEFIKSLKYE